MMRIRLNEDEWPAADRAMWSTLIERGTPFDEAGALSHLRKTSVEAFAKCYGFWLAWVKKCEPDALGFDPVARASAAKMRRWVTTWRRSSATTRLIRAGHLLRILTACAPDADWSGQRRIVSLIRREACEAPKMRKTGRILSSVDLYEAGIGLVESGAGLGHAPASLVDAKRQRDGMMVAFLGLYRYAAGPSVVSTSAAR